MSMDDVPPELIEELIAQYMAEQGAGAVPLSAGEATYAAAISPYDLEGDPYTTNNLFNQLQDLNQLIADPVFAAGGAGLGGFNAAVFQPTVNWEVVESPEYVRWQNYLNTPESFEGMVAAELQEGGTPLSAVRKIRVSAEANPEGPIGAELMALFPNSYGDAIDWGAVATAAREIDETRAAVPPLGNQGQMVAPDGTVVGGGEIVETVGPDGRPVLMRRTEESTEAMEKFDQLGIPYPTQEYTPEMFMPAEWSAASEQFQADTGQLDLLTQAMQDAYQQMIGAGPPRPEPIEGAPLTRPEEPEVAQVAAPVPGYDVQGIYAGAGHVPATDVTSDIAQELGEAIRNRTDAEWMTQNWGKLSQNEQTNVREMLASFGLSPQLYGIEMPPEASPVSERELVGAPDVSSLPVSESGYRPGEITAQLEGVMTTPQGPETWLAGNYDRLLPEEQGEVRQVLANYGLTVEDLMPAGGGGGGAGGQSMAALGPVAGAVRGLGRRGEEPVPPRDAFEAARDIFVGGASEPVPPPTDLSMTPSAADEWFNPIPPAGEPGRFAPTEDAMRNYLREPVPPSIPPYIYDPSAQQATAATMQENLGRTQTPTSAPRSEQAATQQRARPTENPFAPMAEAMVRMMFGGQQPQQQQQGPPVPSIITGEEKATRRRIEGEREPQTYVPSIITETHRGLQGPGRGQFLASFQARSHELVRRQAEREQLYGADFGRAMRAVRSAQQQGVTPTQQVIAQRMQAILNAGIPIGSNPQVATYG